MESYKLMLEICLSDGVDKTGIVYAARMNFNLINPYLNFLISKGYIEQVPGTSYYRTTESGKIALADFKKALDHVKGDHVFLK